MSVWIGGTWYTEDVLRAGLSLDGASEQAEAALAFSHAWLRGDAEFEVNTSGSTGTPKPIMLRRPQMEASALATGAALGLKLGMNALVCLPVRYVAGRMMLVRGFVLGLNLIVVEPAANPLDGLPDDIPIQFAAFVPLQMQTVLDAALIAQNDSCFPDDTAEAFRYRRRLDAMHAILIGGGPVSQTLETQTGRLSAPVHHTYGMTETATHVALRRLNGANASAAFTPLPGVQTGVDARGCLNLVGAMTAGELIQTNDLVELQPDGAFIWIGRWDNVINSGGVKVHVERVESAIETLAAEQPELGLGRRRFFVASVPDERLGQAVTLVLEGAPLDADQEMQLRWGLSQTLPRYQAPRRVLYTPRFAETPTGKIDRAGTMAQFETASASETDSDAASDPAHRTTIGR